MLQRLQKSDLSGEVLQTELAAIVGRIRERATPEVVVLFGSAVTDSLTGASDVDLALLFKNDEAAEKGRQQLLLPGPLSAWPVDLLCLGIETFKSKCLLGGVYWAIQRNGRVLFPAVFSWEQL